jgi:hypothetical protein
MMVDIGAIRITITSNLTSLSRSAKRPAAAKSEGAAFVFVRRVNITLDMAYLPQ